MSALGLNPDYFKNMKYEEDVSNMTDREKEIKAIADDAMFDFFTMIPASTIGSKEISWLIRYAINVFITNEKNKQP